MIARGESGRSGATLPELVITVLLIGLLAAILLPTVHRTMDRWAVHSAATEVVSLLGRARHQAIVRRTTTAVRFDPAGRITLHSREDTLEHRDLRAVHRVELTATRDSIAFGPTGRGWGAANTTVVLRRGSATATVVTSRLGRVRRQ